ncbi:MAG: dihydrodipicolinate synthase family protein [Alphaproteobacteria bacterium]|nr:dihydrodipicolinate synthase family protein [Alphaproteobacteria bacterium]
MTEFGPDAIRGIVPPMTTPFSAAGTIEEAAFRAEARFLLDAGVHGLAVAGSTGEGHALSTGEVCRLTAIAVEEADGRVPVVAGIIVDSTAQAIERGRAAAEAGAAALQVTPVHYLFRPDDAHMKEHFREMADAVASPIVIYNVVPWTYLSPELLVEIMTDIPGVVGVKQSAGDLKLLADLMATAPEGARIMSAVDALMYPSFTLGAHGAVAAILTAAPRACVTLWDAVADGDHPAALDLHLRLLALWNAMIDDNLPAAVKAALDFQGLEGGLPRRPMPVASNSQRSAIAAALKELPQ